LLEQPSGSLARNPFLIEDLLAYTYNYVIPFGHLEVYGEEKGHGTQAGDSREQG
jgi:hypothetical protein